MKPETIVFNVVEVWRGIAANVYVFARREDAESCYWQLLDETNLQENDVQLFESVVS